MSVDRSSCVEAHVLIGKHVRKQGSMQTEPNQQHLCETYRTCSRCTCMCNGIKTIQVCRSLLFCLSINISSSTFWPLRTMYSQTIFYKSIIEKKGITEILKGFVLWATGEAQYIDFWNFHCTSRLSVGVFSMYGHFWVYLFSAST